ncbi:hypothetical protein [Candidatus Electronema sp. JM]
MASAKKGGQYFIPAKERAGKTSLIIRRFLLAVHALPSQGHD